MGRGCCKLGEGGDELVVSDNRLHETWSVEVLGRRLQTIIDN
jgi:hypothetical protein